MQDLSAYVRQLMDFTRKKEKELKLVTNLKGLIVDFAQHSVEYLPPQVAQSMGVAKLTMPGAECSVKEVWRWVKALL